ncbi:hypothetical protein COB57_06205 [Candidatus Peregrinibacteria bacterium]|nr:MAG: hypothetical protein COB57_06205 [Candidatus Peregrinibacteria bacterium]
MERRESNISKAEADAWEEYGQLILNRPEGSIKPEIQEELDAAYAKIQKIAPQPSLKDRKVTYIIGDVK